MGMKQLSFNMVLDATDGATAGRCIPQQWSGAMREVWNALPPTIRTHTEVAEGAITDLYIPKRK